MVDHYSKFTAQLRVAFLTAHKSISDFDSLILKFKETTGRTDLPVDLAHDFLVNSIAIICHLSSSPDEISENDWDFITSVLVIKPEGNDHLYREIRQQVPDFFNRIPPLIGNIIWVNNEAAEVFGQLPGKSLPFLCVQFFDLLGKAYISIVGSERDKESHFYRFIEGMNKYINCAYDHKTKQSTDLIANKETNNSDELKATKSVDKEKTNDIVSDNYAKTIKELENLVGLSSIKEDVTKLINFVKIQQLRKTNGLKLVPMSLHLVFTGNPGTGKTTVARILAQLYKEIGVLKTGQIVEVDRSDLVAGYVGQTALKTEKKIEEAIGGILFIDEAYTLAKEGNDFGQEAIDTLLKEMEDRRDEFIVIVAGYNDPMKKFIDSNPGLKSRFNKFFEFPDYSSEELVEIFNKMLEKYDFSITDSAMEDVKKTIEEMYQKKSMDFANARDIRNYFEQIITRQATRISFIEDPSKNEIMTIVQDDV